MAAIVGWFIGMLIGAVLAVSIVLGLGIENRRIAFVIDLTSGILCSAAGLIIGDTVWG